MEKKEVTNTKREVLRMMSENMSQKQAARALGITQASVSFALKTITYCPHCNNPIFKNKETRQWEK